MAPSKTTRKTIRVISVIAGTLISLACGTNYAYSAWAPQFAARLKLSATQSNLIGTMGNLGMYMSGIPLGMLIDRRGPRLGIVLGAILLAAGYYPIKIAYDMGPGSFPVPILCIFAFFTGAGSCSAFIATLKACSLNFPDHRGTATAFPLAAFGLSAAFFAAISTYAFPNDTDKFLLLLATGCFLLAFCPLFFLSIVQPSRYSSLPTSESSDRAGSQPLHRRKSSDSKHRASSEEPEASQSPSQTSNETSSLLSKSSSSTPGHPPFTSKPHGSDAHRTHHLDIRGFALLPRPEFWQLFLLMGLLTGIGLMTINNIGNDALALWRHYDHSVTLDFIAQRQLQHVTVISLGSFFGRLLSGIGSDLIVGRLGASRFWCLFASALIFCVAQLCALVVSDPRWLLTVSGATGVAYGLLFGVFPSLVAHTFGVAGMSQNWGTMTLAPVGFGNIFNLMYGAIYDRHSVVEGDGDRKCEDGLECYRMAYLITLFAGVAAVAVVLWSIWHENRVSAKHTRREQHEREA